MTGKTVKTVYSVRYKDTKEVHHPAPACPERQRIEREGNARSREVASPGHPLLAFGSNNKGIGIARVLKECRTCRSLRIVHRRMSTRAPARPDPDRTVNRPSRGR